MREVIMKYKLFRYTELSDTAKEKVMEWYLEDPFRSEIFKDNINSDLRYLFPDSKLDIVFSLSCCQGDGLNIYGRLDLMDVLHAINDIKYCGDTFKDFWGKLTKHEQRTIEAYMEVCGRNINLPMNSRSYCCIADQTDFADDWIGELEYNRYKNINNNAIYKLQYLVIDMFTYLCEIYKKQGYKFLYCVEDEEIENACESNDWEFLEDGTFWAA